MLLRAIDREVLRRTAATDAQPVTPPDPSWVGQHLRVHVERQWLQLLTDIAGEHYQSEMQKIAWSGLPILNEWKRHYPDQDPLALHARLWQTRLVCPGGGTYVWNEEWQTFTSTVYGHPSKPQQGPAIPPLLKTFRSLDFGLGFEDQGLRARISLSLDPKVPTPQPNESK